MVNVQNWDKVSKNRLLCISLLHLTMGNWHYNPHIARLIEGGRVFEKMSINRSR